MKITIEAHRSSLRLRWNDGDRRSLPLGVKDSTVGHAIAQKKKAEIELDWQIGPYSSIAIELSGRILAKFQPTNYSSYSHTKLNYLGDR
jgi:uncharacterized protein YqfA (UPF0365 family)